MMIEEHAGQEGVTEDGAVAAVEQPPVLTDEDEAQLTSAWLAAAELPTEDLEPEAEADTVTERFRRVAEQRTCLEWFEWRLATEKALAEQRAVDAAGGDEKALGTNAEARERALTIALSTDEPYLQARTAVLSARNALRLLEAEQDAAQWHYRQQRLRVSEAIAQSGLEEVF